MRKLMSVAAILLAVSVYSTSFAQTTPKAEVKAAKTAKTEAKATKMEAKTEAKTAKMEAKTEAKVAKADAKGTKAKHHKAHKAAEAK